MRCDVHNMNMERTEMTECTGLTGLLHHYVVGNGSSMFVPRRALVHALVMFGFGSADVHHQGPRVRPHGHVGVLIDVEVGPVSRPGETEEQKPDQCHNSAAHIR